MLMNIVRIIVTEPWVGTGDPAPKLAAAMDVDRVTMAEARALPALGPVLADIGKAAAMDGSEIIRHVEGGMR